MWTTSGTQADWMCLLVNTSKEGGESTREEKGEKREERGRKRGKFSYDKNLNYM